MKEDDKKYFSDIFLLFFLILSPTSESEVIMLDIYVSM